MFNWMVAYSDLSPMSVTVGVVPGLLLWTTVEYVTSSVAGVELWTAVE